MASKEFPILEMKKLSLTKNTDWITLRPREMPTMPKYVYVSLKGGKGQVDLTFSETVAYRFDALIKSLLEDGMTVHQTGKAAAIRIETPAFTISEGIDAGLSKVRLAFQASTRLIQFYYRNRTELDQFSHEATAAA
jgi:hypothetical protein